jgi:hypothetical protein
MCGLPVLRTDYERLWSPTCSNTHHVDAVQLSPSDEFQRVHIQRLFHYCIALWCFEIARVAMGRVQKVAQQGWNMHPALRRLGKFPRDAQVI